jgi:hypothetical protein
MGSIGTGAFASAGGGGGSNFGGIPTGGIGNGFPFNNGGTPGTG